MKFAKVVFTVSFSIFLLLGLLSRAMSQNKAPGQMTILYGIEENANTRVPPPPLLSKRPPRGRAVRSVHPQFTVTYTGFTGEARAAFQYAVDIWASLIQSPVTIGINATFEDLGGHEGGYISLGGAAPGNRSVLTGSDVWRVGALADALIGRDVIPGDADIEAIFNSNAAANWYYGTDGNLRSGQYDFVTVVLHEIGHGLGFFSKARISETTDGVIEGRLRTGQPYLPYIYDTFVVNVFGLAITFFDDPSAALFAQFTSNNLFWDGENGKAANDGTHPRLHTLSEWSQGSNYLHLDEYTFPAGTLNSLMTPSLGIQEVIHDPGPITLGMFEDMGWTINKAPVFATTTTTRSVAENTGAGVDIGNPVEAIDTNTSDTLTYSLRGTDAASFSIESTTGQLKTKAPLNYETKNTYQVIVTATDSGNLSDTISVTINVIDAVVFSDSALAAAVRSALRISSSAPIPADVLATLSSLTASRRSITDLTGLEYATDLKSLDLGDNAIVNLSLLSGLTSLTSLDLAGNQIENVSPLQSLSNLESLDLDDNLIENVFALSGLSHLTRLELRDNDVMDATPLSTMTHLTHLYLRGNENLSNIKHLVKLTSTTIDIDLPDPVNIPDANLAAALRTALGFQADDPIFPEDMETLTTFSAPGESIVNLTGLETATALTALNLSDNAIVSLSPLTGLTSLITLNLSTNSISSISSLSRLTLLTDLNLSGNRISSISSLSRLTLLTDLDLSDNTITSVSTLSGLTNLTALDLSDNRIRDVLPLQGLGSLRTLNLSGNDDITNEKAEVLYKLQQGSTNITLPTGITLPTQTDIVVFNNTDLEAVVRSALRISTGYPVLKTKITELTRLTATRKAIADLTGLEQAMGLTDLDLGDNAIVDLGPLRNLPSLEELDLADNQIVNLSPLSNLTSLTTLDLDDNEIQDVSALSGLTSLRTLDLRDNDVMDVVPLKDLTSLTYIYLRGNENITNLEWLGALESLRADIQLPSVVRLPDTNLDSAVRTALRNAGQTVDATLPMSEELLESLETLTASNRNIADLSGLEAATELTSLDLQNNRITDVTSLSKLYALETLMLDGNPILDTSVLRELERRGTTIDITIYRYPSWDVNQDGDVDEADVFLITLTLTNESPDVNGDGTVDADDSTAADANKDGSVNTDDILLVFEKQDRPVNLAAPLLSAQDADLDWKLLEHIDARRLRLQLQILHVENDGSLKYRQATAFLQAVLIAIQPHQTLLLPNYPNPFNPETWLPYQLVRGSDVWITIYDTRGAIVRRLALGYRAEGYYRVRGRAAHWDGRNDVGESVASGIYFYQLETDNVSLLRKMVILK